MRVKKPILEGSDELAVSPLRMGCIGKIKIGEKHAEKGYPMSLDYFKPYCKGAAIYEQFFHKAFGEKPNQLTIIFGTNDEEHNCNHVLELRNNKGERVFYGDGETFFKSSSEKGKAWDKLDKQAIETHYGTIENFMSKKAQSLHTEKYTAEWKESLTLRFMLPQTRIMGFWEFQTHAEATTIQQVVNTYDMVKSIRESIALEPFFLDVRKVESNRALDRKRCYPVVSLTPILIDANDNLLKLSSGFDKAE